MNILFLHTMSFGGAPNPMGNYFVVLSVPKMVSFVRNGKNLLPFEPPLKPGGVYNGIEKSETNDALSVGEICPTGRD